MSTMGRGSEWRPASGWFRPKALRRCGPSGACASRAGVPLATGFNQLGVSEAGRVVAHVAAGIRLGPLALHPRVGWLFLRGRPSKDGSERCFLCLEMFQTVESVFPRRELWLEGQASVRSQVELAASGPWSLMFAWPAGSYSPYMHGALHPHLLYKILEGWSPALLLPHRRLAP